MQLSIIIVNYNVKHFLEQCLCSVQKAITGLEAEVIIVDNNSQDNSVAFLKPLFPSCVFLSNTENLGFSKACNQGLFASKGNYVLFLNPDTIVPEDCFIKCLSFFSSHADAGALGLRMLDGRGRFLKESKRAFPSPLTALYKLSGLSFLFPRSPIFGKYHLGHLAENENHEADVLAGAFMMIKREVLEKTGPFDETFFMYAEDIDLSYRIQNTGFKNYYFAETSIIHFKGESTKKLTLNYVRMFYTAMNLFVKKHYRDNRVGLFNVIIHLAIWVRGILSGIGKFIGRIGLPLVDAVIIFLSFNIARIFWSTFIRPDINYNIPVFWISEPVFACIYLIVAYYAGLYDRRYRRSRLIPSSLISTVALLAVYSLLPEKFRFSRAIVLLSGLLSFFLISLLRRLLVHWKVLNDNRQKDVHPKTLIVASKPEYEKTLQLMADAGLQERVIGRIAVAENDTDAIGDWKKIKQLSGMFSFNEIIFCAGTMSFKNILQALQQFPRHTTAKFHAVGSHSIVGSDSKDLSGETFTKENGYRLADPYNKRLKRLIDFVAALLFIITLPVHIFTVKKPGAFFKNSIAVLIGRRTWIGYALNERYLPVIRKGIIACNGVPATYIQPFPQESLKMADQWYARDYDPVNDLRLLLRAYKKLGGSF